MSAHRALAAVTLCAFMSGCSSYKYASLPGADLEESADNSDQEIWVGQNTRITLDSGQEIAGTVNAVTADSITVGRIGNFGLEKVSVRSDEIALIEVECTSKTATIVTISVIGLAFAGAVFALVKNGGLAPQFAGDK